MSLSLSLFNNSTSRSNKLQKPPSSRQQNPANPLETTQRKNFNKDSSLLTETSISSTIISTSGSSKTMFAEDVLNAVRYRKLQSVVALWAIDPMAGKSLKLLSPAPQASFIPPLLTTWPKLPGSHGALQAGQNKLILDKDIPKLDQPMSDTEAWATELMWWVK